MGTWEGENETLNESKFMRTVIIELDFDQDEVESVDVYKYLRDLMSDDSLNWCFIEEYDLPEN